MGYLPWIAVALVIVALNIWYYRATTDAERSVRCDEDIW